MEKDCVLLQEVLISEDVTKNEYVKNHSKTGEITRTDNVLEARRLNLEEAEALVSELNTPLFGNEEFEIGDYEYLKKYSD